MMTLPALSAATNTTSTAATAHETLSTGACPVDFGHRRASRAECPDGDPDGEVTALPALSTPTHSDVLGQEIAFIPVLPSTFANKTHSVPAPVASPVAITSPMLSVANAHCCRCTRDRGGRVGETAHKSLRPRAVSSMCQRHRWGLSATRPAAGSRGRHTALWKKHRARTKRQPRHQCRSESQSKPPAPAVGSVVVTTSVNCLSTATQSDVDAQEMPDISWGASTPTAADQVNGAAAAGSPRT